MKRGISSEIIEAISTYKNEPQWMTSWRLDALQVFKNCKNPNWGPDISALDIDNLCLYSKPFERETRSWDDVPPYIKETFDKLGIPQYEQEALAGVGAQFESEMLYKNLQEQLKEQGVIFCSMDTAVQNYPDLVRCNLGTVVPVNDNRFAALNSAAWSGGSFVYVPKKVTIELPVHAYFRMQQESMGQFERTLIIAESNSSVHYLEGCSAPLYTTQSLHSGVVEIIVREKSTVRYTTIQNWSTNVYNLVTKRAHVYEKGHIEWIDGNFGSHITMKYPSIVLKGRRSSGFMMSLAVAGSGQHQHTGAKVIHEAPETTANVLSKSISHDGGITGFISKITASEVAHHAKTHVECHSLILDGNSLSTAYPCMELLNAQAEVCHEATVGNLDDGLMMYLAYRGIDVQVARALLINGFVEPFVQQLPLEYAVELNRLIMLDMEKE